MCRNSSMRWRSRNVLKEQAAKRVLLGIPLVWSIESTAPGGSATQTVANPGGMSGIEGRASSTVARDLAVALFGEIYGGCWIACQLYIRYTVLLTLY